MICGTCLLEENVFVVSHKMKQFYANMNKNIILLFVSSIHTAKLTKKMKYLILYYTYNL
uniref:Uncharacterized protein n=1 Tax=Oryza brachyantha TaxID=4533 RepID=J3LEP5_ORYBR